MTTPAHTDRATRPHDGAVDACDLCLALSQLTVTLACVPRLRLTPPVVEQDEDGNAKPSPIQPPLVPCAAGLEPVPGELVRAVDDVTPVRAQTIRRDLSQWSAGAVREAAHAAGLTAVCRCADAYPQGLLELSDPPPVLYIRGDPGVVARCPVEAISVVGTRHPTRVGREAARQIGAGVGRAGGVVVSGMALGIDAAAHEGALEVGGLTIAVLASGADRASPPSHRRLYDRILDGGAVVSELPPGMPPARWTFPARNRIIAALGQVTVVVEAPKRSGALITAEQAYDIGRDVMAVPGSLANEQAVGTNRLLADGAGAVIDGVSLAMRIDPTAGRGALRARGGRFSALVDVLERAPLSAHELAMRMAPALEPGEIELALLDLELAGLISRRPDGRYGVAAEWTR